MKRSDYLQTIGGQVSLRRKRQRNRLHFILEGQEPKSKKAISVDEKKAFQRAILMEMATLRRRHFKSPVAIELNFKSTKNDPPALHTMPKNYLDLLEAPVAGVASKRKQLVFKNDRQVSYLAVRHHIDSDDRAPRIWVKVAPYRDFVADIALLDKILHGELKTDSAGFSFCKSPLSWDELTEDKDLMHNENAIDNLRRHERNKDCWISQFDRDDAYKAWHEMYTRAAQRELLRTRSLTPAHLVSLLSPLFSTVVAAPEVQRFYEIPRSYLISEPFAIDLKHSNLQGGESSLYKAFVREAMASFREKHEILFPLMTQVGITILFQPPAHSSIDLDNLARRIVPFVNEELKPPASLLMSVEVDRVRDPELRRWYSEKQKAIKRMPKHSITHYQVIKLPKLSNDDENGFVRLLLEPGEGVYSLWKTVEKLADKWQDHVASPIEM